MTGIGVGMRMRNLAPRIGMGMDEACRRQHPAKICRQHYRPVYYTTALHHEGKVTNNFEDFDNPNYFNELKDLEVPKKYDAGKTIFRQKVRIFDKEYI